MLTICNKMKMNVQSPLEVRRIRLDSWKEIAVYLGRQVRTVQRWERREGLPVHRQFHVKAGTVCAFKHEIDTWLSDRCRLLRKFVPQERRHHQSVHWSSPIELEARSGGNSCWLWLVVDAGLPRLHGDPRQVPIKGKVDGRKIHATNLYPIACLTHGNS
jgi:hypothetical protein